MRLDNLLEATPPQTLLDASRSAITVVFTTWTATAAALRMAAALATGWKSSITIVAAQVVPWPADLHETHIPIAFNEERLRSMAGCCSVETAVNVYICRDRVETLVSYIPPERIVVIGARKRIWPNPDLRLAQALRRAGFEVIVAAEK